MSAIGIASSLLSGAVFVLAALLESSSAVEFDFVCVFICVYFVCLFVEDNRI